MDSYLGSNNSRCRGRTPGTNVYNITSYYTDDTNSSSILATSVAMFVLTSLFFNVNLFFSRFSDINTIHNAAIRLARSATLSLSLPIMSYLFSDARDDDGVAGDSDTTIRARLILIWMLLVELLRRKAVPLADVCNDAARAGSSYTADVDHAARIAWLGNLVFFSLQRVGTRAAIGVLWVVAAAKLVQSVFVNVLVKRSFAVDRRCAAAKELEQEEEQLASCRLPVMGEEVLVMTRISRATATASNNNAALVTVGMIWTAGGELMASNPRLKRLCLSLALFKLLRRTIENSPAAAAMPEGGSCCRDLIFNGLRRESSGSEPGRPHAASEIVFQTVADEVRFLSQYYHSIVPVVLASPAFFLVNYLLFPFMVCCLGVMTVVLCGRGDVLYTFRRIREDNYSLVFGVHRMAVCLLTEALRSMPALLSAIDLTITLLLFVIFLYQEVWECVVFLLSDWLMVSLLCNYTVRPRLRGSAAFGAAVRCILCARGMLKPQDVKLQQLDVLSGAATACRLSLRLPAVPVPPAVKRSVVDYLETCARRGAGGDSALSNGVSAVARRYPNLAWACESDSVANVILTWHIATSLLEAKHQRRKGAPAAAASSGRSAATRLSKYCAYLVAFHPELLPDDRDDTEDLYTATTTELRRTLGLWGYYISPERARCETMMAMVDHDESTMAAAGVDADEARKTTDTVVRKGARLGKALADAARADGEAAVWEVLGDLWVKLVVYVAPASDEAHVRGHKEALVDGGQFVTVLWALATHTGVRRRAAHRHV